VKDVRIPGYLSIKMREAYLDKLAETKQKKIRVEPKTSGSEKRGVDEVILSPWAAEIRKSEELLKNIPEIRQEKVEDIKEQIESKEYSVSGALVARSIVDLFR